MNNRGESLYLRDDMAIQGVEKVGYNEWWNDRKFQEFSLIEGALRQGIDLA